MLARAAALALICAAVGPLAIVRASDSFPYRAYIASDDVNVRSGPGDNYYPVTKLGRGDVIEVYRHDPGGWYAIRPPAGSYSWVSGEFLKPGDGGRATVIGDRVVARVGSSFSDIRDVIQVRLDRGEEVEVLEAKRLNPGPGAQTWYKIAPPPGEFRWVSGKFIERDLHTNAPRPRGPQNNLLLARMGREETDLDAELRAEEAAEQAELESRDGWDRKRQSKSRYPTRDRYNGDDRDEDFELPRQRGSANHTALPYTASPHVQMPETLDLPEYLDELDLELSAMVTEEPTAWDFGTLTERCQTALARAETAVDRGQARMLLANITRFEDIRQRYSAVAEVTAQTDRRNQQLASRVRTVMPREPNSMEPRYDGTGKLAQVVSGKSGSPQFALLDSNGAVRYYVTASPGVNLRNYVGMEVGVSGTLGYLPEHQAQHVTAKRIVPVAGAASELGGLFSRRIEPPRHDT